MPEITERRAAAALLILRVSLGVFLLQWSLEKLIAPESGVRIGQGFYGVTLSIPIVIILGAAETVVALALLVGAFRRWSYGPAILIHAVSVISTWRQLLHPYGGHNHLFIAGVPVLAALILLYMMREWDAWSVEGRGEIG